MLFSYEVVHASNSGKIELAKQYYNSCRGKTFFHLRDGQIDSALFWTYEPLNYLRREKVDDSSLFAKQYNLISYIEVQLGHEEAAIKFADSAILILETQDTLTNDILFSYRAKGKAYQQLGDFYRANVAFKMVLYIADSLQQKSGALNDLGTSELHIGNLNAAEIYFKRFIADEKIPLEYRVIGKMNLTDLYLDLGKLDKAKEAWEEVEAYMKTVDIKDEPLAPDFFQIKSHLQQTQGHHLQSIESLRKAIKLSDHRSNERRTTEKFRCNLVTSLLKDSTQAAEVECRKAYHYFSSQGRESKDPFEMVSTHLMASVFYEQYQQKNQPDLLDSCLLYTQKAQEISDLLRKGFLYRNSKYVLAKYLKANVELGIDAAHKLFKEGNRKKAQELFFYFMEKGKSQVLLDELEERQRAQLKANGVLDELYMLELQKMEVSDSIEKMMLDQQIEKVKGQLKNVEGLKPEQDLSFKTDLAYLIQLSKESSSVFLEFGEGKNYLYILMINDGQLFLNQVAMSKDSLKVLVAKHLSHLKDPTISVSKYTSTASDLYTLLLEPLSIKKQNITIIPSELMAYLPFSSLVMSPSSVNNFKKLSYTIEKWNFSYSYSSAFLSNKQIKSKQSFCGLLPMNQKEGDLSSHESLVNKLKSDFGGVVYQKEKSFSLSNVSDTYDFVHISSHGTFSKDSPAKSYLFMPGSDSSKLTMEQLYVTTLNTAPFIVLNACETGEGELRSGEGIDNFTRAFIYSGASGIVESSWKINADQTATIFKEFYSFLLDGSDTKTSLRKAQLAYLKDQNTDNNFAHPYYWSGFKHFGTAVTLGSPAYEAPYWLIMGAVIILFVLVIVWWKRRIK